ncbi:MAG: hypothetical protein Q8Q09_16130 [Deltaproteobacteria bacterium]|nr:hypothetical protein [Deltaproteobacteria bacterium]
MAKRTLAQVCETVLSVRAHVAAGLKVSEASKRAGLTAGTYKRWLEVYAAQDLPAYVLPAPLRGVMVLSGDGATLFSVGVHERGYELIRYDALSGRETARATFDPEVESNAWLEVTHAAANEDGTQLLCVSNTGALFAWNLSTLSLSRSPHTLQSLGTEPMGRGSSSHNTRLWSRVSIAPDLKHLAVWSRQEQDSEHSPSLLRVWRIADNIAVFEKSFASIFSAYRIEFHPTRPLIATLGINKLVCVMDFVQGHTLIESGPQAHDVSFGPRDTLHYDDWYGKTQELDYAKGTTRELANAWGSIASLTDRFVTTAVQSVKCWRGAKPKCTRTLTLEGIVETTLSRDGRLVVVRADRVCVWDLDRAPVTVASAADPAT